MRRATSPPQGGWFWAACWGVLWVCTPSLSGQTPVEALVGDLAGGDAKSRLAAVNRLRQAGADAVVPLVPVLESENPAARRGARRALEAIAHHAARPEAEEERAAVSKVFLEALGTLEEARARGVLVEILGFLGGAECVPPLVRELNRPETREAACSALARISDPAAARALREALEDSADSTVRFRVLLVNSVGGKSDSAAASTLAALAENDASVEVRLAALEALSRNPLAYAYLHLFWDALPTADSAAEARRHRRQVWSSLLRVGEAFLDAGERGSASDLYCDLLERAADSAEKCSVIVGLSRASRRRAPGIVYAAVHDADPAVRATARRALGIVRDIAILPTITELLDGADAPLKRDLLGALAHREEPEAIELAAGLLDDGELSVRAAALAALAGRPGEEAATALAEAVVNGGPVTREGAIGVLARLPGDAATGVLLERARTAPAGARVRLLRAVALRGDPAAEALLLESAGSSDEAERLVAYAGLGTLAQPNVLPALLAGLDRGGADLEAAERALAKWPSSLAVVPLVEAAASRRGAPRAALLRVVGRHPHPQVVELLLKVLQAGGAGEELDEPVRLAALEGLCVQEDDRVVPFLLEAATRGPETIRPRAVLGALRFGPALEARAPERARRVYQRALEVEGAPVEALRQALDGVRRLADVASLRLLEPLLDDLELRPSAATVVLELAVKLPEARRDEAIALFRRAIPLAPASTGARAAVEKLRELGVDYDYARETGFVTRWWLLGPLPNPENRLFESDPLNPETVRPRETNRETVGSEVLRWRPLEGTLPDGVVDLSRALRAGEWQGAYAYAEVTVREERRVTLRFGSDDSLVVWHNGKKIHSFAGRRALAIDQDSVDTKLTPGTNRILLKVLNESGGWSFCLRVTDRRGSPLVQERG